MSASLCLCKPYLLHWWLDIKHWNKDYQVGQKTAEQMCAPSPAVTLDFDASICHFHYFIIGIKSINSIHSSTLIYITKGTRNLDENPSQFEHTSCLTVVGWSHECVVLASLSLLMENTSMDSAQWKAWEKTTTQSQVGHFSKFLLEKWAISRRWFFTVTLGINCQYIFVNLGMSPNSSFLPPQGTVLMSGSCWLDRSPGCLATGTSLESGVTVTTRVRA